MVEVAVYRTGCGYDVAMVRGYSSLGLFGIFGRSADLRAFDQALRSVDLHPRLVPEAVKLTVVALLKDHADSDTPPPQAYRAAAEIVAYCMIGPEGLPAPTTGSSRSGWSTASSGRWRPATISMPSWCCSHCTPR